MSKGKNILLIASIGGIVYSVLKSSSNSKYTSNELVKINKYKKYLEDKDFVIVEKQKFNKLQKKNNNKFLSLTSIPKYYSVARTIAKFVL